MLATLSWLKTLVSRHEAVTCGGDRVEAASEVWLWWKENIFAAAEKGIGRKKLWRRQKDGGL